MIANESMIDSINSMQIDEDHLHKLSRIRKVQDEYRETKSDHNSIVIEIDGEIQQASRKQKIWNIKKAESWKKYEQITEDIIMNEKWEDDDLDKSYNRWSKQIKSLMYQCLDRITTKPKATNNEIRKIIKEKGATGLDILTRVIPLISTLGCLLIIFRICHSDQATFER